MLPHKTKAKKDHVWVEYDDDLGQHYAVKFSKGQMGLSVGKQWGFIDGSLTDVSSGDSSDEEDRRKPRNKRKPVSSDEDYEGCD